MIGQAIDNDGVVGEADGKGAPTGDHKRGEFYVDSNGVLFFCQNDGNPGDWKQVQLL